MGRKHNVIGEQTSKKPLIGEPRINKPKGLLGDMKVSEASHGQIVSGKGPDQFLDSIGARAATLYDPVSGDSHILMKDNFDLSNAEDQSEYGHELVHVAKSGGIAGAKINDAEEKLAQSVESMIFHQAGGGKSDALPTNIEDLFQGADNPAKPSQTEGETNGTVSTAFENGEASATLGYQALREDGMTHSEIVYMLTQMLVEQTDQSQDLSRQRGGSQRGFSQ